MDPILLGSHDCDPDGCMTETLVRAERSDCAGHSDQWSPLAADAAPPVRLEASERSGGYCRATVRQAWPHEIGWNVDAHAIPFAPFEWGPYPEHRCLSGGGFGTAAAKWVMDLSLETPGTLSWEANPAWISSAGEQGFLRLTIDGGQPPYGAADYSMNYRAGAVGQTQGTTSRTVVQAGTLRLVVELQISPYSNYEARPPATGAGRLFNLTFAASP
ncbi:MAG: hypothetical protein FJ125_13450 [Deltaproteobacteria bacterium]|nr:hypothetical protein [Deltaproteobacteria bacterium]